MAHGCTGDMESPSDPAFARQSTLRTIERTIVEEFGEDPVIVAQIHGNSEEEEVLAEAMRGIDDGVDEQREPEVERNTQKTAPVVLIC